MSFLPGTLQVPDSRLRDISASPVEELRTSFETMSLDPGSRVRKSSQQQNKQGQTSYRLPTAVVDTNIQLAEAEATHVPLQLISDAVRPSPH